MVSVGCAQMIVVCPLQSSCVGAVLCIPFCSVAPLHFRHVRFISVLSALISRVLNMTVCVSVLLPSCFGSLAAPTVSHEVQSLERMLLTYDSPIKDTVPVKSFKQLMKEKTAEIDACIR